VKSTESKGLTDQADEGTDDFDRTISLELTNKEYDVLRQIERALEKIERELMVFVTFQRRNSLEALELSLCDDDCRVAGKLKKVYYSRSAEIPLA